MTIIAPSYKKSRQSVDFHRNQIMKKVEQSDLLTLEDSDEYKLSSIEKLLNHLFLFQSTMKSIDVPLQVSKYDKYEKHNLYLLTDTEYSDFDRFEIRLKSDYLNPEDRGSALHAGFNFCLYLIQDAYKGRSEIADWIKICISYTNTVPMSWSSSREHIRALTSFVKPKDCYFNDIPMEFTNTVSFARMSDAMSFKTDTFIESVDDACTVLCKIMERKQFLKSVKEE